MRALFWALLAVQSALVIGATALAFATRARAAAAAEPELPPGVARDDPRVVRALAGVASPLWWRRFAAARALVHTATDTDRGALLRLVADRHPAVQGAASIALQRYADPELLRRVIDGLSGASPAIRTHQLRVLGAHPSVAAPMLLERIREDAPAHKLYAYITAASVLDSGECMTRVSELSAHPNAEVRVAVARVLRSAPGDAAHVKLLSMLRDPDWRVRAQAARGLATMRDPRSVDALVRAIGDPTWWVRFRAGLALAAMGEPGREALARARSLPDPYARDMAALVSELSESTLVELSAG